MRFEIKILTIMSFLYGAGAGLLAPIYALYVENIGGNIVDAGIAWAIFSISMGVLLIVFGKLENHLLDKRLMMVFGYFIISFCAIGLIFIQTPIQLFLIQFCLGVSLALIDPAFLAIFGTNEDKGKESEEWGAWAGGKSIIIGIVSLIGALIVNQFGWTILFIMMFMFQFSAALLSLKLYIRKAE